MALPVHSLTIRSMGSRIPEGRLYYEAPAGTVKDVRQQQDVRQQDVRGLARPLFGT